MTGSDGAALKEAIASRRNGGTLGGAKFGDELIGLAQAAMDTGSDHSALAFREELHSRPKPRLFRREMYFAMCSALRTKSIGRATSLEEGAWQVQNRARQGRKLSRCSVGSALLVKGNQFEPAVIAETAPERAPMGRNDWYVALTRATRGIRITSQTRRLSQQNKICSWPPGFRRGVPSGSLRRSREGQLKRQGFATPPPQLIAAAAGVTLGATPAHKFSYV